MAYVNNTWYIAAWSAFSAGDLFAATRQRIFSMEDKPMIAAPGVVRVRRKLEKRIAHELANRGAAECPYPQTATSE